MFQHWPFFNTLLRNVHVGLGRADLDIAELYSRLAPENSRQIFDLIRKEFDLTRSQALSITGDDEILDTEPWLQRSIRVRNPYVDPLNYIQVAMLEKLRKNPELNNEEKDAHIRILVNSVNGIAAGLQSVG